MKTLKKQKKTCLQRLMDNSKFYGTFVTELNGIAQKIIILLKINYYVPQILIS